MEFTGHHVISAEPDTVWAALNDPDVLKSCIPGCETLTKVDATSFAGSVKVKIGPVSATFHGTVALTEADPPRKCLLRGEGQGGIAGFARGQAALELRPDDGKTVLTYRANANLGGKLAQVGQRLIDGAVRQIAEDFFARFSQSIAPPETPQLGVCTDLSAQPPEDSEPKDLIRGGITPQIWVIGLIAIVAILVVLFGFVLR